MSWIGIQRTKTTLAALRKNDEKQDGRL
jgi:hypothetical protein